MPIDVNKMLDASSDIAPVQLHGRASSRAGDTYIVNSATCLAWTLPFSILRSGCEPHTIGVYRRDNAAL